MAHYLSRLVLLSGFLFTGVFAQTRAPAGPLVAEPPADAKKGKEPSLQWHDVTTWGVEGRGFIDAERKGWFDRLPSAAEGKVTNAVWNLSRHSAGMLVRFRTDATTLWAN
jgi:hypothetical protein